MALMDDLRTKLTAIGEAIRGKTGGTELLTMDAMVEAINGITTGGGDSGGGSSGGSSGIANGYTVNFYDVNKSLVQSHSAIYGYYIDQPISHLVDHWEDSAGHLHQFPLVVDADDGITVVDVYEAGASTWERTLYNHFGVDKDTYPYLAVMICNNSNSGASQVIFSNNTSGSYHDSSGYTVFRGQHYTTDRPFNALIIPHTTFNNELTEILSGLTVDNLQYDSSFSVPFLWDSDSVHKTYTNFAIDGSKGRLDELFYTSQTCADILYAYFSVDSCDYPYLIVESVYNSNGNETYTYVAFATSDVFTTTGEALHMSRLEYSGLFTPASAKEMVDYIVANASSSLTAKTIGMGSIDSNSRVATNYELSAANYSLNDVYTD